MPVSVPTYKSLAHECRKEVESTDKVFPNTTPYRIGEVSDFDPKNWNTHQKIVKFWFHTVWFIPTLVVVPSMEGLLESEAAKKPIGPVLIPKPKWSLT